MKLFMLILLILLIHAFPAHAQTYTVKRIPPNVMHLTGKGDDTNWNKAPALTGFSYPWEKEKAPATSFSALWDGAWLYCLYQVQDDSVITVINRNDKLDVGGSDRVEIFMSPDSTLSPYYCLEIDATGRVLDYQASFYRKMNYSWKWPGNQLIIKTANNKNGYVVEVAISIGSLNNLGLLKNNRLMAGLFRAERKSRREGTAGLHWISWINPQTPQPDFHTPSAFGVLVLE